MKFHYVFKIMTSCLFISSLMTGSASAMLAHSLLETGKYMRSINRMMPVLNQSMHVRLFASAADASNTQKRPTTIIDAAYDKARAARTLFDYVTSDRFLSKVLPLEHHSSVSSSEKLMETMENTNAYIRHMEQYPRDSWIYKREKKRLENNAFSACWYITDRFQYPTTREYALYMVSLIKTYNLEFATQEDVERAFRSITGELCFIRKKDNYSSNPYDFEASKELVLPETMRLAHALCRPDMPQKYEIRKDRFDWYLGDLESRIKRDADDMLSTAYQSSVKSIENLADNFTQMEKDLKESVYVGSDLRSYISVKEFEQTITSGNFNESSIVKKLKNEFHRIQKCRENFKKEMEAKKQEATKLADFPLYTAKFASQRKEMCRFT